MMNMMKMELPISMSFKCQWCPTTRMKHDHASGCKGSGRCHLQHAPKSVPNNSHLQRLVQGLISAVISAYNRPPRIPISLDSAGNGESH